MEVGTVRRIDIEQTMRSAYLSYAMSVITARALPDVRDGLKPVQRRILYAMWDMSLRHEQPPRKSARIVGEVLGKYHPHGDVAVYDAMVRMAQDFAMRYVLVEGQGNFGSVDGDGAAAMRYTEARLSALGEEMLTDLDKDTVNFSPNFDGSLQEPLVLPAKVPNLLVNGVNGIAVGMATNIPPHNLGEVVDATVHLIERYNDIDDVSVDDLMRFLPGPDFPSAGTILGMEGIRQAYATGKGRLLVRAQAHIEEMRGGHSAIIVTELPYQVNKAGLIERIAELVRDGRLEGISDLRDESDRRSGMRVVIELKRGQDAAPLLSQLLKQTQMQTTFGVNMLALVDGEPRVLPLKRILAHTIEHRHEVLVRRARYELERALARAHVLEGLITALDHLDEVIDTIRRSRTAETAQQNLMAKFKLSEIQARAILDMQLRRLAALERRKIEEEYQELLKRIDYLRDLLGSKSKILSLIKDELLELKKRFGDPRRTRLSAEAEDKEFHPDDLLPDEDVVVALTYDNAIFRLPVTAFHERVSGGGALLATPAGTEQASRALRAVHQAHSREVIVFVSDQGHAFGLAAHQIPDGSQPSGQPLRNLVHLAAEERVVAVLPIEEFKEDRFLCLATRDGKIKRLALSELAAAGSSGVQVMGLEGSDSVVGAALTAGQDDILLVTRQGKAIRFQEDTVRPQGRSATGMRGITLRDDEAVAALVVARPGAELVLVTTQGYAKRTPLAEFPVQGRGGQGVFALDATKSKSTGPVVGAAVVTGEQHLGLVTAKGSALHLRADGIPRLERGSWGRLVTKSGRGAVVAVESDQVAALMVPEVVAGPAEEPPARAGRKRTPIEAKALAMPPLDSRGASSETGRKATRPRKSAETKVPSVDGETTGKGSARAKAPAAEPQPPREAAKAAIAKGSARKARSVAEAEPEPPGDKARAGQDPSRRKVAAAKSEPQATEAAKRAIAKGRAGGTRPVAEAKPEPAGSQAMAGKGPSRRKVAAARSEPQAAAAAKLTVAEGSAQEAHPIQESEAQAAEEQPAAEPAKDAPRRARRTVVTQTPRRTK